MSNRRRLRVPGRYEPQPQIHTVQEPAEAIRPLVQALAGSIRRKAVAESTATLMRTPERTSVTEASVGGATATKPGRMLVRLIKAGISLNGNAYSAQVLREAAQNRAWPRGCQAFCDHASEEEEQQHPSGSVKNLAGVLTEDARWDEATQSLVAEVRLFAPWRETLTDMAEHIGMSIRAWVTGEHGTYEGHDDVFVVERIEAGRSVDFVTVPAAGGAIISVLEAVGNTVPVAEARNAGHWFEANIHSNFSRVADDMFGEGLLTREERITLSSAVGDALAAFSARIEQDAAHLYTRDPYAGPPDAPPLVPVAAAAEECAHTHPETAPDDPPTAPATPVATPDVTDGAPPSAPATPSEPEEEPVSGIQTGAPPEQAGIATVPGNGTTPATTAPAVEPAPQPTTESMASAFKAMLSEAVKPLTDQIAAFQAREGLRDAEARTLRHRQHAAEAVTAALQGGDHADVAASISARVNTRVLADVPTTAEGAVDETRLAENITAVIADEATHVRRERANALAEAGVGLPFGVGASTVQESAEDDGLDAQLENLFRTSLGMDEAAAKIAAKGRGV